MPRWPKWGEARQEQGQRAWDSLRWDPVAVSPAGLFSLLPYVAGSLPIRLILAS